jgi:hypothetical protein
MAASAVQSAGSCRNGGTYTARQHNEKSRNQDPGASLCTVHFDLL